MENASKALIIGGAILISILLITIGIVLINSSRDVVNSGATAMSSQAIQAFNSQFTQYEGTNKSSKEINQLLNTVISSNASHSNQVVVRFYKQASIANKYKSSSYSPTPAELTFTNNVYISERGVVAAIHGHHIVNISKIKDTINYYSNGKYSVKFFYCNESEENYALNKDLNLSRGCIFIIWIDLI